MVHSPRYTQVRRRVAPIITTYLVLVRKFDGSEFISKPLDCKAANAAIDRLEKTLTIGDKILWCESDKLVWNSYN